MNPPPVIWAIPLISYSSIKVNIVFTYIFVGLNKTSANVALVQGKNPKFSFTGGNNFSYQ